MRRLIGFAVAAMLAVPLLVAVAVGPAMATDLAVIPLNKDVEVTPGMYAHLIQVTISDTTYGASYAQDPNAVVFPMVLYTYQNRGTISQYGHLQVQFIDDKGQIYNDTDYGTIFEVQPGNTSEVRFLEVNIPKERKVVELKIILGLDEVDIPISYQVSTPAPGSTSSTGTTPSAGPKGNVCIGSLVLPLLLVGIVSAAWAGRRIAKK